MGSSQERSSFGIERTGDKYLEKQRKKGTTKPDSKGTRVPTEN